MSIAVWQLCAFVNALIFLKEFKKEKRKALLINQFQFLIIKISLIILFNYLIILQQHLCQKIRGYQYHIKRRKIPRLYHLSFWGSLNLMIFIHHYSSGWQAISANKAIVLYEEIYIICFTYRLCVKLFVYAWLQSNPLAKSKGNLAW